MLSLIPIGIPAKGLLSVMPFKSMAFANSSAFSSLTVIKESIFSSVSWIRFKVSFVKSTAVISFETNKSCNSVNDLSYNFSIRLLPPRYP